jgi:peptidoglycan/LPS O-acetylase OafA/YrhL
VGERDVKHILYLDGWRGLAILGVMLGHFIGVPYINMGRLGVELFFVLSGRLMAEILFVQEKPLAQFYPRRISRIYPALLFFVVTLTTLRFISSGGTDIIQALAALTFTINYLYVNVDSPPVLGHIWSLCIEEHMYIVLGLIAAIHRRRRLPLVPIFCFLSVLAILNGAAQTYAGGNYYEVYWRTDVRGSSILLGAIAFLLPKQGQWQPWPSTGPLLLAVGVLLNLDVVPDPVKYSFGTAALAQSLVLLADAPTRALYLFENPLIRKVGLWSFSLYLWQQPFSELHLHGLFKIFVMLIVFGLAAGSYYLIEKPARRRLNAIFANARQKKSDYANHAP